MLTRRWAKWDEILCAVASARKLLTAFVSPEFIIAMIKSTTGCLEFLSRRQTNDPTERKGVMDDRLELMNSEQKRLRHHLLSADQFTSRWTYKQIST